MWLFFALFSRFLWSLGGAIDQVLSRVFRQYKTLSVMALQNCAFLPLALVTYPFFSGLDLPPAFFFWISLALAGQILGCIPYYQSMRAEQAYNVTPYMELTPVLLTLMAMAFLGERLTALQMAGGALVILSGFAFSWDFTYGKVKMRLFLAMSVASFFFAAFQIFIKMASEMASVWAVTYWFCLGRGAMGLAALAFMPRVRHSVVHAFHETAGKTVLLSLIAALGSILALASLTYAFVIAPSTGHVAALSGTQPFFAFLLVVPLARFYPGHFEPLVRGRELKWKVFLLFGIFLGTYLLTQ
jgi:drug/metabolite transporter (DMT)-like permease